MPHSIRQRTLRLGLALLAAAAAAQVSAEIVLYEHADFGGRSFRAYGQTNNLVNVNFNDLASSVVVRSGSWQLCGDADFRGQCITLSPGSYASLGEMGLNDRVSSVRPSGYGGNSGNSGSWGGGWGGGNAAIELYEHADYGGRSISSSGSANLVSQGFNDRVSSIVIRSGRWEFCTDADYRGRCQTLGPGSYGNLVDMGLNDQISSLRPSGGPPAYGGRPSYQGGWGGDDGSPPEIVMSGNRSGRVTFQNGCVAYYNGNGQRYQNLPACHGRQVQRADEAMARYRNEQGLNRSDEEHPWVAGSGYGGGSGSGTPEVILGSNREGEVIFSNNCVVYFNAMGLPWKQQPSCSSDQVRKAREAMDTYRREQGIQ